MHHDRRSDELIRGLWSRIVGARGSKGDVCFVVHSDRVQRSVFFVFRFPLLLLPSMVTATTWSALREELKSSSVATRLKGLASLLVSWRLFARPLTVPDATCVMAQSDGSHQSLSIEEFSEFVDISSSLLTDINYKVGVVDCGQIEFKH